MTTPTVLRSAPVNRSTRRASARVQSPRGALGGLVVLLALPITIVYGMFFPVGGEVVIHLALAVGTLLVASSVFDFSEKAPAVLQWAACVGGSILGLIFLAQGLSDLIGNEAFKNVAFSQVIGGWLEMVTVGLVMAWFVAIALSYRLGATMILGLVSSAMVIGLAVWSLVATPTSGLPQELRLLFLLPMVWFLFVSTRPPAVR